MQEEGSRPAELPPGEVTFLSLNRFERKKNVALAIRALAAAGSNARLVVAGGWDSRLDRNTLKSKASYFHCFPF